MNGSFRAAPKRATRGRFGMLATSFAVVLTASACGTTVPLSQRGAGLGPSDVSPSVGAGESLPGAVASGAGATGGGTDTSRAGAGSPNGAVAGSASGSSSGNVAGSTAGSSPGPGVVSAIPAKGRGWDAQNVYIGLVTANDKGATFAGMGAAAEPGDATTYARAIAKYYNERGGLFGRKIVIRIYDSHTATRVANPDAEAESACTHFVQDAPVVAVINPETLLNVASFRVCLKRAHLPLISPALTVFDDQMLRESSGLYFSTVAPSWNKFAQVFVDRLVAQGYFSGWDTANSKPTAAPVRVGIWMHDDHLTSRVYELLAAALAKRGYAPAVAFRYSNFANEALNAVVQMRNANVTHVIGFDPFLFQFAVAAEGQRYRPRYGIHTSNAPNAAMEANAPAPQQVGAMGVGFAPAGDTGSQKGEITPGGKFCRAVMKAEGVHYADRLGEVNALSICDAIRLLAGSALSRGGFTAPHIVAGLGDIGPKFTPATTFASGLTSTYPVLSAAGLDLQFVTSCSCYRYPNTILRRF